MIARIIVWIGRRWEAARDLAIILFPFRASVLILLVLPLLFMLDQSQDAFRALVQDVEPGESAIFFAACLFFSFEVFYWARFLSRLRRPLRSTRAEHSDAEPPITPSCVVMHAYPPPIVTTARAAALRRDLPRWLGMLAAAEVAIGVAWANTNPLSAFLEVAIASAALLLLLALLIWGRRALLRWLFGITKRRMFLAPAEFEADLDPTVVYKDPLARAKRATRHAKPTPQMPTWFRWLALGIALLTALCFLLTFFMTLQWSREIAVALALLWAIGGLLFVRFGDWLPTGTQWWVSINFVVFLPMFALSVFSELIVHGGFPSPTIIMTVAAAWVFIGTLWLVYPAERYAIPVTSLVVALGLLLSLPAEDNHDVRVSAGTAMPNGVAIDAGLVKRWYDQASTAWSQNRATGQIPLIIIATAGGASRAGYWTGKVLSELERGIPDFHRYVFAISSVSGGSLGAATWRAVVEEGIAAGPASANCAEEITAAMLKTDYLSPVFLDGLFADLAQRILPGRLLPDRASALERSWELGWRLAIGDSCLKAARARPGRFAEPFHAATRQPPGDWRPYLLLNGTSEKSGRRIITSELKIDPRRFPDAIDFFTEVKQEVDYSTAVHNSARFPYIDVGGNIWIKSDKNERIKIDRIVDGGYFENFGAATAEDLRTTLEELRPSCSPPCNFHVYVIQISSDPGIVPEEERDKSWEGTIGWRLNVASDVTTPPIAFFATRDGLGYRATAVQERNVWPANYVHFRLHDCLSGKVPMSWAMSTGALAILDREWCSSVNNDTLEKIVKWFPSTNISKATLTANCTADQQEPPQDPQSCH